MEHYYETLYVRLERWAGRYDLDTAVTQALTQLVSMGTENPTQSILVAMATLTSGYADLQKTMPSLPHMGEFTCQLLMATDDIAMAYWIHDQGVRRRIVTNRKVVTDRSH